MKFSAIIIIMLSTSCKALAIGQNFILKDGRTAVMVAIEAGQPEIVQEFLKRGCEVVYQEKASDSDNINTDIYRMCHIMNVLSRNIINIVLLC